MVEDKIIIFHAKYHIGIGHISIHDFFMHLVICLIIKKIESTVQ